jgi:hypothetical protein
VLAGKEYGSGSSRDWAAKGPKLLGVRAVIAESYERIHRSNLIGMGVLPLQYMPDENAESLGLTGREEFSVSGVENGEADEVTVGADDMEFRRACGRTRRASATTSATAACFPTRFAVCFDERPRRRRAHQARGDGTARESSWTKGRPSRSRTRRSTRTRCS